MENSPKMEMGCLSRYMISSDMPLVVFCLALNVVLIAANLLLFNSDTVLELCRNQN